VRLATNEEAALLRCHETGDEGLLFTYSDSQSEAVFQGMRSIAGMELVRPNRDGRWRCTTAGRLLATNILDSRHLTQLLRTVNQALTRMAGGQ
jgi:hypothetical protein